MWPSDGLESMGTVERDTVYPKGYFSALTFHGRGDEAIPILRCEALSVPHNVGMWHQKLYLLCFVACTCLRAPGHPGRWKLPGFVDFLMPLNFFISPGHAQSSFIAVGTFDINATNCPGTDYSCYVVVIIKLIIFLMLQICHSSVMCFFHVLPLHLILTFKSRSHSWHWKIAHLFLKSRVWEYSKKRKWKI